MKKALIKVIALTLAFVMVLGMVPIAVFAVDQSETAEAKYNGYELTSSTSLGKVFAQAFEENGAENSAYSITDIVVVENEATVSYQSPTDSTLIVALFNDEGRMLGSGVAQASSAAHEQTVIIDMNPMPEFFTAKAYLLDSDYVSLCKEYVCYTYTEKYVEFLSKTVDDFDEELVINFDELEDNNFAVLTEDATVIETVGNKNVLVSADDENGIYVFSNADETITGLSFGDIFDYDCGNDEHIVIMVNIVKTVGNTTTVSAADAKISDLFEYVKIDTTAYAGETDIDTSEMDEGLTYLGAEGETEEVLQGGDLSKARAAKVKLSGKSSLNFGVNCEWEIEDGKTVRVGGNFNYSIGANIKCTYDIKLFAKDYLDIRFEIKTAEKLSLSIEFESKSKQELKLPQITIPLCAGVKLKGKPTFVVSAAGSAEINTNKSSSYGFTYDTDSGYHKIDKSDSNVDLGSSVSFEIKAGIKLEMSVVLIEVVKVSVTVEGGLKISGEFQVTSNNEGGDIKHQCDSCIDGDVNLYLTAKFTVTVGLGKLKTTVLKVTAGEVSVKLCDFYISFSSVGIEFGIGECPNISYKVTFTVTDYAGNPLPDVSVANKTTDSNGQCYVYFSNGNHTVSATKSGYLKINKSFTVDKSSKELTINMSGDGSGTGGGTDIDDVLSFKLINNDTEYEVTGCSSSVSGEITIPSTYKGLPVTSIGESAFAMNKKLTHVIIPDSVTNIGAAAFDWCKNLTDIEIPDSVTCIKHSTFFGCDSLKKVIIGNGVTTIGETAFYGCNGLTSVTIPGSVVTIENAFHSCSNLSRVIIEEGVENINSASFYNCSSLTTIYIPYTVKYIGQGAFQDCSSIETVYYSGSKEGWKNIVKKWFNECLTDATIVYNYTIEPAQVDNELVAQPYNRAPLSTSDFSSLYYVYRDGGYQGKLYTLLILKEGTEFSNDNLLYIGQTEPDSNGRVDFFFVPKTNEESDVFIIGYFGSTEFEQDVTDTLRKVSSCDVTSFPNKNEYLFNYDRTVDLSGIVLTITYTDGSTQTVEDISQMTTSGIDCMSLGEQTITVSYKGVYASYGVTVAHRSFTVTWIVDGVETVDSYEYCATIAKPADPAKQGYTFKGWTPTVLSTMPAENLTYTAVFELIPVKTPTVDIKNNPGTRAINYGDGVKFTAIATDLPDGAQIKWFVNSVEKGTGETFTFSDAKSDATITVKIIDRNGNALTDSESGEISDTQVIKVKAGFFQKLISFFKNLFRIGRITTQAISEP